MLCAAACEVDYNFVFNSGPRVFWFEADQTRDEREVMINSIPKAVQDAARVIMITKVLHYFDITVEEYEDMPLLYFTATYDEIIADGDEEIRQHSDDWRLILLEGEHGFLCDFNGWPGDNESGGGVYYERATDKAEIVFTNEDGSIITEDPYFAKVAESYQEYRRTLGMSAVL